MVCMRRQDKLSALYMSMFSWKCVFLLTSIWNTAAVYQWMLSEENIPSEACSLLHTQWKEENQKGTEEPCGLQGKQEAEHLLCWGVFRAASMASTGAVRAVQQQLKRLSKTLHCVWWTPVQMCLIKVRAGHDYFITCYKSPDCLRQHCTDERNEDLKQCSSCITWAFLMSLSSI